MRNVALPLNNFGYANVVNNLTTLRSPNLTFVHTATGVYTFTPGVRLEAGLTICEALLTRAQGFARAGVDSSDNVVVHTFAVDGTTAANADFSLVVRTVGVSAIEANP